MAGRCRRPDGTCSAWYRATLLALTAFIHNGAIFRPGRRDGRYIFYSLVDPRVSDLLRLARELLHGSEVYLLTCEVIASTDENMANVTGWRNFREKKGHVKMPVGRRLCRKEQPATSTGGPAYHSRFFRVLASERRLRILGALDAGPICIGGLAQELGMPQGRDSTHLQLLADAGLVGAYTAERWRVYRVLDRRVFRLGQLARTAAKATSGTNAVRADIRPRQ